MNASNQLLRKALPFLAAILMAFQGSTTETTQSASDIIHTNSVLDRTLISGQAVYEFEFKGIYFSDSITTIGYSIDGKNDEVEIIANKMRVTTTAGKHIFRFSVHPGYKIVQSDSLPVASQYINTYDIQMQPKVQIPVQTCKPVIYLYPKETQETSVQIDIFGNSPFYYPRYENGWKVTANPDGSIIFNEEKYNYLFWEAIQDDHLASIQIETGFVVKGVDAQSFLEDKLDEVGFTSEEKADFITYWGPRMAAIDQSYVRFEWNETCDNFAELNITPRPDQVLRLYIFIAPVTESFVVSPQQLPTFTRSGFTVLEWGGQFSNISLNKAL